MTTNDLQFYGKYADLLEERQTWLTSQLQEIMDRISTDPEARLQEHVLSRIKSSESLQEKMKKSGEEASLENAFHSLSDIIGVRIVVHFVGDVYEILNHIESSSQWQVQQIKDYIKHPKKNGYRSLHVILTIPFASESLNVEIQIRTIAMDCWASLEHQLKYKKSIANPELISEELSRCAAEMASTDLTLQTIREMIQKG